MLVDLNTLKTVSNGFLQKINEKADKKEIVQSDWNQNDKNAKDYINNRTHWEEKEKKITEILPLTTLEFTSTGYGGAQSINPLSVIEGETYIVKWDEQEYPCICFSFSGLVLGNVSMLGATDTGEPFLIFTSGSAFSSTIGTHTIAIYKEEEDITIHQLDPKYIKDMYYDNGTITEVLPETTIEGFAVMQDPIYGVETTINMTPVVGATYIVNWDGVEYNAKGKSNGNLVYIGNENYVHMIPNGDIPFAIICVGGATFLATESTASSHTISVTEVKHDLKQLDTKYLPIMEKTSQTVFEMNDITGDGVFETSTDKILIGEHLVTIDGVSETLNFVFVESEQFSFAEHSLGDIESFCEDGKYGIYLAFLISDTHSVKIEKINNFIKEEYLPPELNKEQYIPTTERITAEVGQTIVVEEIDEEGRPASWKAIDRSKFDAITLTDEANGYEYIIKMKNGTLTSICKTSKISVTTMPAKTEYLQGELFDPTGMAVVGVRQDGTTYEIDTSTYTAPVLETPFFISYTEAGETYVAAIDIDLTPLSLVDFDYTSQPDGTYKINSWKGTLNGEPSTELVVPNSSLIII